MRIGQESEDAGPKWKESSPSTYIRERSTTARNAAARRHPSGAAGRRGSSPFPPSALRIRMFSYDDYVLLNDAHFGTFAFKNETFPECCYSQTFVYVLMSIPKSDK